MNTADLSADRMEMSASVAVSLSGAGLTCCVQAARPNWSRNLCRRMADALRHSGVRRKHEFNGSVAWLEYIERELSHLEQRNPVRPHAPTADDALLRSWQERWRRHRELQRRSGR